MNLLDDLHYEVCQIGFTPDAYAILDRHNASEDDSHTAEGYMSSMSDNDILSGIAEM